MSGATYRIDVEHRPSDTDTPYYASICRLSDGEYVDVKSGRTASDALHRAHEAVLRLNEQEETTSYYVGEDGTLVADDRTWRAGEPTLKLLREYSMKAHG